MADRETIKELLVKLGYEVDIGSQDRAQRSVDTLTKSVMRFGGALLSLYAIDSIVRVNRQFSELYNTSKRLGTTVENIQGIGRAAELTGSSIGGMQSALESFSSKMRTLGKPFQNWVNAQAGTDVTSMDRIQGLVKLAEKVNEKYKGNWPIAVKVMEMAGVGEREFMSLLDPMTKRIMEEQNKIAENFQLNTKKMMEDGQRFTVGMSSLFARLQAVYTKTVVQEDMAKGLEDLSKFIDNNKDNIVSGLTAIGRSFELLGMFVANALGGLGLFYKFVADHGTYDKEAGIEKKNREIQERQKNLAEINADRQEKGLPKIELDANSQVTKENTEAIKENTKAQEKKDQSWWDKAKDFYKEHDPAKWIAERMKEVFGGGADGSAGVGGSSGRGSVSGAGGSPGAGGGGSASAASRASMMKVAMDQLRKEGVPEDKLRAAAANLVGQADMESGLDPSKSHDSGTGYGLYGARLERRTAMFNWLAQHGYDKNSAEGQMRYMAHEAMSGKYPNTRNALMTGALGAGTTNMITKEFENPRVVNPRHGAVEQAYRFSESGGKSPSIVDIGKELQKQGFRISEHPAFGGVSPVHHGRGHYEGRAIDVNMGRGTVEANDKRLGAIFDKQAEELRKRGLKVIWRQPGHFNHMHVETPGPGASLGRGAPLGHQVSSYHTLNNNQRTASLGPFNTTINVPGGQVPGTSTLTHAVENSMRKVAAAGISNLGTQIS